MMYERLQPLKGPAFVEKGHSRCAWNHGYKKQSKAQWDVEEIREWNGIEEFFKVSFFSLKLVLLLPSSVICKIESAIWSYPLQYLPRT